MLTTQPKVWQIKTAPATLCIAAVPQYSTLKQIDEATTQYK